MKQPRNEKSTNHKDTRWDRIRKRHSNNVASALKSDVVRRFIEKDYIGQHNEAMLCGEHEPLQQLDPVLVMDMRHRMFQKIPRKLPLVTVGGQRNLDACVSHNLYVEERYIMNELNKFRQQLEKNHRRNKLKMKLKQKETNLDERFKLDNESIMRSLEAAAEHIEQFYEAPIEALAAAEKLTQQSTLKKAHESNEKILEDYTEHKVLEVMLQQVTTTLESVDDAEVISDTVAQTIAANVGKMLENVVIDLKELNDEEDQLAERRTCEVVEAQGSCEEEQQQCVEQKQQCEAELQMRCEIQCKCSQTVGMRCVRFDESVEVRKYKREDSTCSNTSDGIDSVISDLAEEALFELQLEEDEQQQQQQKQERENCNENYTNDATEAMEKHAHFPAQQDMPVEIKIATPTPCNDTQQELLIIKRLEPTPGQMNLTKQEDPALSTSEELDAESILNHEQNLVIEQLFQARAHTNQTLLRKCFLKWIHYTTIEKIEREDVSSKSDRIHKINLFLDKIRKEKMRLTKCERACGKGKDESAQVCAKKPADTAYATKKYQNKIKIQQDIIDMQRVKLERQERMIMELKLNKLSEEAKEARQELKNELKSVIRSGDPKSKAKAKCLQLIGNLRDEQDDELARLQGKALLMPKFLQQMQERALEHSIRHEQARQRRLQQEAEKEAQRMAAEEAKRLEDEAVKRQRIEALREKRRQEKMYKVLRERERQRALEAKHKADEFCRRLLLRRIGMEGFKRLLQRKRENKQKCEELRRRIFKRTYFVLWRDQYLEQRAEKTARADELYERILKRPSWKCWLLYVQDERCKYRVAVDWCELKLSELMFTHWANYSRRMSLIEATKLHQAASHHEWHLKWKVLDCWQRLPQVLQLERETEERRQRWRMKIWELLPDYTPNRED